MSYGRIWPLHEVICNTSPLQYLYQVDLLEVLRERFDQVLVPEAVEAELDEGRRRNVPLPKLEALHWVTIRPTHDLLPSPSAGSARANEPCSRWGRNCRKLSFCWTNCALGVMQRGTG